MVYFFKLYFLLKQQIIVRIEKNGTLKFEIP